MKFKCKKRDTTDCTKWLCDVDNCKKYDPIKANNQPEPTTAEMLLWLAENESVDIWHTANKETAIIWRNGEEYKFIFKTLAEAINAAYEWAKQEERNANIGTGKSRYYDIKQ